MSFKVALHGFDQRSESRMSTIFKVSFQGKFEIDSTRTAPVALVDIDHDEYKDITSLEPSFDTGATILLSEKQTTAGQYRLLHKPVKLDLLRESLVQAFAGLANAPVEQENVHLSADQQPGSVKSTTAPTQKNQRLPIEVDTFDPSLFFAGWLMALIQDCPHGHSLYITSWKAKSIIIDPAHNAIFSDIGKNELRNLSITPLAQQLRDQAVVHYVPGTPSNDNVESLREHRLDQILYTLARMTSKGRCPKGTDPDSIYYLEQWPSFTRLPDIPNGIRIAAAWFGEPQTLQDLSRRLAIPTADVYSFFFFCQLMGITGIAKRSSDRLAKKAELSQPKRSRVLASLFGHISRKLAPQQAATSKLKAERV